MAQIVFFLHFKKERELILFSQNMKKLCVGFFSPLWKILCKIAAHGDVFRILLWSRFILFVLYTHTHQPTTFLNSPKDSCLSDGTVWFSTGCCCPQYTTKNAKGKQLLEVEKAIFST